MPVEIKLTIEDKEVRSALQKIQDRAGNLKPVMGTIGEIVRASIRRNFEEGGRPRKWEQLKAATIVGRIKRRHWPGKILIERGVSGGLLGSLSYRAFPDKVVVSANKEYAAIHHFGGKAGRGGKVSIPARPFLMVQDEDWREIRAAIADYLTRK